MTNDHQQSGPHNSMKTIKSFISGGIAGVFSKTLIAPIERIKYLFIVQLIISSKTSNRKFTYQLFFADFKHVVQTHGVFNLWRGNLLNIARIFPHAAIVFHPKLRISQCSIISGLVSTTTTALSNSKSFYFYVELLQESPLWPSRPQSNSSGSDWPWKSISLHTRTTLTPSNKYIKIKDFWVFTEATGLQPAASLYITAALSSSSQS